MKVLIFSDTAQAEAHVAAEVLDLVAGRPDPVLGLATGGTMERVYARIVERARAEGTGFGRVSSFNLDEYWGVPADHPCSYSHYMTARLFAPLGMNP
ncbi:hypothetical protein LCGC14_2943880, partial [marine sediment metagenome]